MDAGPPLRDLLPSPRILLGPGPSMADPRVLRAMATPLLGQFDPEFTHIMNEVMALSRALFQTASERAFPVSGTGRAGLEAAMVSLLEPGDRIVIGECGRFGLLLGEIARRCGADVAVVRAEWGRVIEPDAVRAALGQGRTAMVAMVHGETSTGVLQPLAEIGRLARAHEALLLADVVVTLGGSEVALDDWGVDVGVGGSQKCLSCPSGLAPLAYNRRAEDVLRRRRTVVRSNYLDLGQLETYWSAARFNHHTAPTAMVYGLREALRAVAVEGPQARFRRHRLHGDALRAGLAAPGLRLFGAEPPERRLPMLTPVVVPEGVDEGRVRGSLSSRTSGSRSARRSGRSRARSGASARWATRPAASTSCCSWWRSRPSCAGRDGGRSRAPAPMPRSPTTRPPGPAEAPTWRKARERAGPDGRDAGAAHRSCCSILLPC